MRYISCSRVAAARLTTPADNPLVTDDSRLVEVWFAGEPMRRQMFKKVTRTEQETFAGQLLARGFLRAGSLLVDPGAVLFAEMENELLGGVLTLGWEESGKPIELKVSGRDYAALCANLNSGG